MSANIDPIVLAVTTSAVSKLADEFLKGAASEAGKTAWSKVKALLGWTVEPAIAEVPARVATQLSEQPELVGKVAATLAESPETGEPAAMIGYVRASGGKWILAHNLTVGTLNM